ncbi:MAG: OmpH family outer membrane protein [Bacteroidales bacterium]|nr:OmpH family outer membrane protein [Bacteroidales bacterium]
MKNLFKAVLLIAFLAGAVNVDAQSKAKFGHINFGKLYQMMPGQDSVQAAYNEYQQQIQQQFQDMQGELQAKMQDYEQNLNAYSKVVRQTKEREINDLQRRIQEFQSGAQEDLMDKENELTAPIIEKARNAVKEVAKENGYSYIFNSSEGLLLYAQPSDDIMPLVKKKLGLEGEE